MNKILFNATVICVTAIATYGFGKLVGSLPESKSAPVPVHTSSFLSACAAPTPESGQRLGCALVIQGYIAGHDTLVALNPSVERKAFCVPPTVPLGTVLDSAEQWTFEHPEAAAGIMEQAGNSGALAIITMVLARDYPCSKDPKVGV